MLSYLPQDLHAPLCCHFTYPELFELSHIPFVSRCIKDPAFWKEKVKELGWTHSIYAPQPHKTYLDAIRYKYCEYYHPWVDSGSEDTKGDYELRKVRLGIIQPKSFYPSACEAMVLVNIPMSEVSLRPEICWPAPIIACLYKRYDLLHKYGVSRKERKAIRNVIAGKQPKSWTFYAILVCLIESNMDLLPKEYSADKRDAYKNIFYRRRPVSSKVIAHAQGDPLLVHYLESYLTRDVSNVGMVLSARPWFSLERIVEILQGYKTQRHARAINRCIHYLTHA